MRVRFARMGKYSLLQAYHKLKRKCSDTKPSSAMAKTAPDGTPKVIERYYCSGCGDVDISNNVTATADGTIVGLSGRTLKISQRMKEENVAGGDYRIGIKGVYDLYPSKIREKLVNDMKLKEKCICTALLEE